MASQNLCKTVETFCFTCLKTQIFCQKMLQNSLFLIISQSLSCFLKAKQNNRITFLTASAEHKMVTVFFSKRESSFESFSLSVFVQATFDFSLFFIQPAPLGGIDVWAFSKVYYIPLRPCPQNY